MTPTTAQQRAEAKRCSVRVYDKWRIDVSGHQCTKAAKVENEGKWFCKIHDPDAVKQRDQLSYERYREKYSNRLRYTEVEYQSAIRAARQAALTEAVQIAEQSWSYSGVLRKLKALASEGG